MKSQDQKYEAENKLIVNYLVDQDRKIKYKQKLAELQPSTEQETSLIRRPAFGWMKYAAVGIFMMSVLFLTKDVFFKASPSELAIEQIHKTRILGDQSVMRKDVELIEKLRADANYAFINHKYQDAARLYEEITIGANATQADHLYLAISYLRLEKPNTKLGLESLDKISDSSQLAGEAKWFKALALIYENRIIDAKALLNDIVSKKGYKYLEAAKILDVL
jgi:hypothetical protein